MEDIQIFTTPILDGIKIKEYKGMIIVRNVRAVNIIRDFFTSFRDVFGEGYGRCCRIDSGQKEPQNAISVWPGCGDVEKKTLNGF